jgi:hypothetical protein
MLEFALARWNRAALRASETAGAFGS